MTIKRMVPRGHGYSPWRSWESRRAFFNVVKSARRNFFKCGMVSAGALAAETSLRPPRERHSRLWADLERANPGAEAAAISVASVVTVASSVASAVSAASAEKRSSCRDHGHAPAPAWPLPLPLTWIIPDAAGLVSPLTVGTALAPVAEHTTSDKTAVAAIILIIDVTLFITISRPMPYCMVKTLLTWI